jgi:predicted ATPase
MQHIALDNFRVFGSSAAFDLAPVTVLTGKNNSGKSSLIKAFLVLADYLEQDDQTVLRLDGPRVSRHRINNWQNLLNWQSESQVFRVGYWDNEIRFTYEFGKAPNSKVAHLQRFHMEVPNIDQLTLVSDDGGKTYKLNVSQKFLDYVAGGIINRMKMRNAASYPARIAHTEQQLAALVAELEKPETSADSNVFTQLLQERQMLTASLENLRTVFAKGQQSAGIFFKEEVTPAHDLEEHPTLAAIIEAAIDKHVLNNAPLDESYTLEEVAIEYGVSQDEKGKYDPEEMERALSTRSAILNQEREHRRLELKAEEYRSARQFRRELENAYATVEHLGANRTHQARLYLTSSGQTSEINVVADRFQRLSNFQDGAAQAFLQHWMPRFELGDDVVVTDLDNAAIRIEVMRAGQPINLADMGFGAGQLLTLLLHIASILQQREAGTYQERQQHRLVLIEEPEANLHPHFQSVLAELFAETAHRYNLQFIIETHSEYLIRNIQVLVKNAGGNHKLLPKTFVGGVQKPVEELPVMFKVYYLDQPSEANGQQYGHEMRLREDGMYMDEFGEGFLMSESANLAFKLF